MRPACLCGVGEGDEKPSRSGKRLEGRKSRHGAEEILRCAQHDIPFPPFPLNRGEVSPSCAQAQREFGEGA
jgi:hypothetical protein